MIDFTPFHEVINERVTNPNADYYEIPWWDAEIKQFSLDVDASIKFIKEECSDEELWWLDEVFDDLIEVTQSVELLNSLRERAQLVDNTEWKENILESIKSAADFIKE